MRQVATGEKNRVIAGALEKCFNEVYREVFGVLTIHIYASLATVLQMTKN
jgi:hypothetical protein